MLVCGDICRTVRCFVWRHILDETFSLAACCKLYQHVSLRFSSTSSDICHRDTVWVMFEGQDWTLNSTHATALASPWPVAGSLQVTLAAAAVAYCHDTGNDTVRDLRCPHPCGSMRRERRKGERGWIGELCSVRRRMGRWFSPSWGGSTLPTKRRTRCWPAMQ